MNNKETKPGNDAACGQSTAPCYVIDFFPAHNGYCIFTTDSNGLTITFHAGPFKDKVVAKSEKERLESLCT